MGLNSAFKVLIYKRLYSDRNGEDSTSVFPLYIIVILLDDGCNFRPEHAAVKVMNKYTIIYSVVLIGESYHAYVPSSKRTLGNARGSLLVTD